MKNINELLKNLHIHPNQISLFETAFTHPSYNGEAKTQHHDYERLEFMGDSIVNFVVADLIFRNFPNRQEGDMTKIRASLVRGESLAKHARALHLGDYILLSHGLQLNGGSDSSKVLENVFEAFMGATYMDQGFDFTYQLLRSLFIVDIQNFDENQMNNYKLLNRILADSLNYNPLFVHFVACQHTVAKYHKYIQEYGGPIANE